MQLNGNLPVQNFSEITWSKLWRLNSSESIAINMPLQIFGKSSKNPSDVVRSLKEALITLESKENNTATGETSGMIVAF